MRNAGEIFWKIWEGGVSDGAEYRYLDDGDEDFVRSSWELMVVLEDGWTYLF